MGMPAAPRNPHRRNDASQPIKTAASQSGMTLVELIVVVVVLGTLAILVLRLSINNSRIFAMAKKSQTMTDERNIVAALKAYKQEYGKYPVSTSDVKDTLVGDPVRGASLSPAPIDNSNLFNVLRGIPDERGNKDHQGNPRRVVFFEGKYVTNPAAPKSGFHDGSLFDPWGTQYFVIMDTNSDQHIQVDTFYQDFKGKLPEVEVGVFSFGRDQQLGSPGKGLNNMYGSGDRVSDDMISWQQ